MQALLCRRPRAALRHLPPATRAYLAAGQQQVAPSGARAKIAAWIVGGSPLYTEVIARQGFDAVVVDQQHGTGEVVPLLQAIDAARDAAGNAPLAVVRIEELSDGAIAKALDAGAAALICPMINSVEECEAFVRATKFPPAGHRSYGPHRAALGWEGSRGDWTRASNACVQSALEDLDAILSVDGLSGIFVGPNDLGLALGHDPTDSPEGEVLEAAAIFCADPATARRMADEGFDLVVAGIDLGWAASGAASALAGVRGAS
ncbi:hypothetical protein EMIHUDRAFT_117636 [Emiliania huxleyi CCMP1516]|uniref:HpcH/HpaI aldolase/citrate lyase domain-containing protein n=2 Tax=Emiliania huxleyi TaxID=2903 RepID=A0A0D3J9U8_EMIH1|nr:hypothetical protein EMIHUDRAFT_117636 [Emiliania huxleyi CCMP1516]EOD20283.1 hypothetical protein EMIHUDRAFT_117636 [Emiliania huxleyi CCMP1516]|eukprot:XP_005772712.1 hypothetical protein EMIHUDRAFT_117636 [Emiliania huxleyi CCMP1516]